MKSTQVTIQTDFRLLRRLPQDVQRRANRIVIQALHDLAAAIDARVPVESGDTRASKEARMIGPTTGQVSYAGATLHLEYGTARMKAQPFIRPGLRAVKDMFIRAAQGVFRGL